MELTVYSVGWKLTADISNANPLLILLVLEIRHILSVATDCE